MKRNPTQLAAAAHDPASSAPAKPPMTPDLDQGDDARRRVAAAILTGGPSTAADLAERLHVTPTAVRRHLSALEEVGHLTSRAQRVYGARGRGRPARVFVLTDAGRAEFDSAYDELAIRALDYLERRLGPGAVTDFAEESLSAVEERFFAQPADLEAEQRLLAAFNAAGYVATLAPVASGRQLCQHHCPIAHVAREHPELCIAETKVISRLLGTHVQRLATIAQGDEVCTTHIPHPVGHPTEAGPRTTHSQEGSRS